MKIINSLKKLIKRINNAQKRTEHLYKKKGFSTNPFDYIPNRTYVWIDQTDDSNNCRNK